MVIDLPLALSFFFSLHMLCDISLIQPHFSTLDYSVLAEKPISLPLLVTLGEIAVSISEMNAQRPEIGSFSLFQAVADLQRSLMTCSIHYIGHIYDDCSNDGLLCKTIIPYAENCRVTSHWVKKNVDVVNSKAEEVCSHSCRDHKEQGKSSLVAVCFYQF